MQQAQGRDEGAVTALEEHELALRVEDELDVVLAFAYDRVALLRQQVLYVRLECRVPARKRVAVWRRGRLARGRREAREVRWRLGPFDTRWHWSRIAARIPLCSDDLTLLCVLMFSARENLRGDSMGERSWNPRRGLANQLRQCGARTCGTSRKQVRSGRDVPGTRQLLTRSWAARSAARQSLSSGEGKQRTLARRVRRPSMKK